jgi:NAD(P)-dependent dehydrogenase (short-subunit alcohol dehydrogenase family)
MDLSLKGKAVLVTGGNRGIGLVIAQAFAEEGADVAICGRDEAALEAARASLVKHHVRAEAISADLFTAEGCARSPARRMLSGSSMSWSITRRPM